MIYTGDAAGALYKPPPAPAPYVPPSIGALGRAGIGVGGATNADGYYGPSVAGPETGAPGYTSPNPYPTPAATAPRAPFTPPSNTRLTLRAGYTPDYLSLIQNDPALIGARNNAASAETTAGAARRAAIRSALIRFGKLPAGFADQYGDVDQGTVEAAQANPFSTIAQLARDYSQNSERFKRSLAARGMLQSGDLNYGEDQLSNDYGRQQYDAANQFTGEVSGDVGTYTGVLGQNARDITNATGTAESNVYSNPAYRPVEAQYADYDPFSSTRFGKAVYKGSDGSLYDENGATFNPAFDYTGNPTGAPSSYTTPTEQNPNPNPDQNGVPMSAGFYGFDQYGNWIG